MLKFFRKIRQNLLSTGKTGKYLQYAIGEIFLVVIGILIALYVNDVNEKKKFDKQEHLFMIKMHEDLQIINNYMGYNIQYAPKRIEEAQLALYAVQYCKTDSITSPILEKTLATAGNLGMIYVRNATYEEMLANGSFSRMKNDSLKNYISDLYGQLDYLNESISYFRSELGEANKIIWRHVEKEFRPEISKSVLSDDQITVPTEKQIKVKYDLKKLCESSIFKNALVEIIDSRKDVYSSVLVVYESLNITLEMLKIEIESHSD